MGNLAAAWGWDDSRAGVLSTIPPTGMLEVGTVCFKLPRALRAAKSKERTFPVLWQNQFENTSQHLGSSQWRSQLCQDTARATTALQCQLEPCCYSWYERNKQGLHRWMDGRVMAEASACSFASPTSSTLPAQPTEFQPWAGVGHETPILGLEAN